MKTLFYFAFCLLLSGLAQAQLLANQDAIILQTGATLAVQGGIINTTGSSISNSGTIVLSGDWLNNSGTGLLSPNSGTVLFNGTAQQVIGGANSTTFNNLDISATGVSVKLEVNTIAAGTNGMLTLGSKPLLLNEHTLNITNPATSTIAYTTGSVIGETSPSLGQLSRTIGTNTGSYAYPAGSNAGTLIPLTVNITTAGTGTNASLAMATYPTGADNLPLPVGVTTLNGQQLGTLDRFWIITPQNYTTLPTAMVTFSYQDSEWGGSNTIPSDGNLQLYRWNGTSWEPLTTTNNAANNTLTVSNLNQYGIFAAADVNAPLPVRLLTFDARRLNAHLNELTWTTVSEENNKGFEIEKSSNARQFSTIGFLDGAGTIQQRQIYHFTDRDAAEAAYYRLKMVDTDEGYSYSQKVFVAANGETALAAQMYPNPTVGLLHLQIDNALGHPVEVAILNATGEVLQQNRYEQPGKNFSALLDLSAQPRGVYLVHIFVNGTVLSRKVIVE